MKTVRTIEEHKAIMDALQVRFQTLQEHLKARPLHGPTEGAGRAHWKYPERLVAFTGPESEIRLAILDLQTVLKKIVR
jgi:di/tripeptidase